MSKANIRTVEGFRRYQASVLSDYEAGNIERALPTNGDLRAALKSWRGKICLEYLTNAKALLVQVVRSDLFDEMKTQWPDDEPARVSISVVHYSSGLLVLTPL